MKTKMIKKVSNSTIEEFNIQEFIEQNIGLNKNEYKNTVLHFTDSFIYIEYERVGTPPPPIGFQKH